MRHAALFYGDDGSMIRGLARALDPADRVLAIVTPAHGAALRQSVGAKSLTVVDAETCLSGSWCRAAPTASDSAR